MLYKEGKYESAVECYSHGIMLDPLSAALPANRAMALMKLERLTFRCVCVCVQRHCVASSVTRSGQICFSSND